MNESWHLHFCIFLITVSHANYKREASCFLNGLKINNSPAAATIYIYKTGMYKRCFSLPFHPPPSSVTLIIFVITRDIHNRTAEMKATDVSIR